MKKVERRKSNPQFYTVCLYTVINDGSGSDFLTCYGSGSGSTHQKVMVPTVPVPVPVTQHCISV